MNRLTHIFVAGAILVAGGLAVAQGQMNMSGHDMSPDERAFDDG